MKPAQTQRLRYRMRRLLTGENFRIRMQPAKPGQGAANPVGSARASYVYSRPFLAPTARRYTRHEVRYCLLSLRQRQGLLAFGGQNFVRDNYRFAFGGQMFILRR